MSIHNWFPRRVRHRLMGCWGTATGFTGWDRVRVDWDDPRALIRTACHPHNLVFRVPARSERV